MATRTEVAKLAGVSVGTVSNVMNNKSFVKESTVEKVRRAMAELNYVPDYNAKSLASGKSNHIGIAVYEMTNPYHAEIIQGIEEYAAEHGYITTVFMLDNTRDKKLDEICKRRLDGLVNFMSNELPSDFIGILTRQNVSLVNFAPENSFIVMNDYTGAMEEYMRILRDLGHKNVAYLSTTDPTRFSVDTRGGTFLARRKEYGFSTDDDLIVYNYNYELKSEEIGYKNIKQLLARGKKFTALFATNDLSAFGAMRGLHEAGLSCPGDVSVIGCDGLSLGRYMVPSLSTISFDKRACGEMIAGALINHIENPSAAPYTVLPVKTSAVLNESVSAPKQ